MALPNMDDMIVVDEWTIGMPYLPMLTEAWLTNNPHPNYVDGWNLWCDVDTKATYVVMEANPECQGLQINMGADVVVQVPYTNILDATQEGYYGQYDNYDPDYDDGCTTQCTDTVPPQLAMNQYKVGYMWDNNGKGYMLGNKYHQYGWWCLDDILWNMMLWDMKDEYTLRTDEEEMARLDAARESMRQVTGGMDPEEYLGQLGLQMGGQNMGQGAQHLEGCLGL
jgi:hypothetical protein